MTVFALDIVTLEDKIEPGLCLTGRIKGGLYSSIEKGEAVIREYIERGKVGIWPSDIIAFYLYEKTIDPVRNGEFDSIADYESVRSYFADGTLNAVSDCDDACVKKFEGRDPSTIRFRIGDKVWVPDFAKHRIRKGVVSGLPFTKEQYQARFAGKKCFLDYTDDAYTVEFGGDSHTHPSVVDIFPEAAF